MSAVKSALSKIPGARPLWDAVRLSLAVLLLAFTIWLVFLSHAHPAGAARPAQMLAPSPARVSPACTAYLNAGQPVPPWIAAGSVLCLHGGDYPHAAPLAFTANQATYQSAPGEQARIVGVGITLYGHDLTLARLEVDNGGTGGPSIPAIALKGDRETLDTLTVHNGHYNGVEVRGQYELLTGNTIYNFNASPADAECVMVSKTANHIRILGNSIQDCTGNGIELYTLDGVADPQVSTDVLIDSNTIRRGTLPHSETLIGVKDGSYITVTHNYLSGTQDYNWAMGARGWTDHLLMADNTLRGNYTGIELGLFTNGGAPHHVLVTRNDVDNAGGLHGLNTEQGGGFGINLNGCFDCQVIGNTFRNAANYAVFVDGSQGWQGGVLANNLIADGVTPRLWPGSPFTGVAVGPNAWSNTSAGFLAASNDTTSLPSGLPTTPPTATATPTRAPTPTATASPTASATASPTPSFTGCWDLRGQVPLVIACP